MSALSRRVFPVRRARRGRSAAYLAAALGVALIGCGQTDAAQDLPAPALTVTNDASPEVLADGKQIFRFETFGNEPFWTDTLHLHEVVQRSVDPTTALGVGLKVDVDALPEGILEKLDLKSPSTTVALLKLNAVVGLQATIDANDQITHLGITCALCHSTVDNSLMPGIGHRMDGWPNRDLDIGAIVALSPALTREQKVVYESWGLGKYDPRYNMDGLSTPLVVPPAYGLSMVKNDTYTGDGSMSYWNAYVAVTQMHGRGSFSDPRLGISVEQSPDRVQGRLDALRAYQRSLEAPPPPFGSVDLAAAERGRPVFDRVCASCHVEGSSTDNNSGMLHTPEETGMDGAYALRTANKAYRTTPLRGLWQHPPYFHDGSAATLEDVVAHYDGVLGLMLDESQRQDLVAYLKTL